MIIQETALPPGTALLLPLFLPVMFVGVAALLAHLGGWAELAKRYPGPGPEDGKRFSFSSASIGTGLPVNYAHCLFVRVGRSGLGLWMLFPFRLFHPPLFIPWTAVADCRKGWFLFRPGVAVHLAGSGTRIVFRGWAGSAVLLTWEGHLEAKRLSAAASAIR
jgi:hypothetical protein